MDCTECGKVATRMGTQGRAYCTAHAQHAWKEIKRQSIRMSIEADILSEEARTAFAHERMVRAV